MSLPTMETSSRHGITIEPMEKLDHINNIVNSMVERIVSIYHFFNLRKNHQVILIQDTMHMELVSVEKVQLSLLKQE